MVVGAVWFDNPKASANPWGEGILLPEAVRMIHARIEYELLDTSRSVVSWMKPHPSWRFIISMTILGMFVTYIQISKAIS